MHAAEMLDCETRARCLSCHWHDAAVGCRLAVAVGRALGEPAAPQAAPPQARFELAVA